ncbi:DUF692 domain-containing protein [Ferrovibrio sp. MS7]|uniref:MNIO family bufferin maturase n=1 Tax=Ferrovibrio plantarum TaxID=3119164 RepID=UPI003135F5F2
MRAVSPRLGLPQLGYGLGLRQEHLPAIMAKGARVDWFEVITENLLGHRGYLRQAVNRLAETTPIVLHGVTLSIGGSDPLDLEYLRDVKRLAAELHAPWVSDHLCWTSLGGHNSHDLLPLPLTEASLRHVTARVAEAQDVLGQRLVLENPSSYLRFRQDSMPEWEFLARLAEAADCGLLLDVNNVYVSGRNHGFDPEGYIRALPSARIVQLHLAGATDCGTHLIDTHDHPVRDEVWTLYRLAQQLTGGVATLLEWDAQLPSYDDLLAELAKAWAA